MSMNVGLVYDPVYLKHDTGQHVENAGRLQAVLSHLEQTGLMPQLTLIKPRAASTEEIALVHQRQYISRIQEVAQKGGGWLDADTVTSSDSYQAAIYAAGGVITATEAVINGEVESAFALVRPPGHHAIPRQAMGFCLFNKHPFYPETGSISETGSGAGKGTTLNIPLPAGCGDAEYLLVFEQIIVPAARRFNPQLILVSAGYDAHWADPIALMQVTTTGIAQMARVIKALADELCNGRLAFTLEGGYNPTALATSIKATLDILLSNPEIEDPLGPSTRQFTPPSLTPLIKEIKETHNLP